MLDMPKRSKLAATMTTKTVAMTFIVLVCGLATILSIFNAKKSTGSTKKSYSVHHGENSKPTIIPLPPIRSDINPSYGEFESVKKILKKLEYPIEQYLSVLHNSIKIVHAPSSATPALKQAIKDCKAYPKSPLIDNQHALELRFPHTLQQMKALSQQYDRQEYSLLWQNESIEPLFYFLQSYQYYVVHCSYNYRGKESWDKGIQYLTQLSEYTVHHSTEFQNNFGVDFMVPASHPKSGPYGVKTYTISAYQRQTFLRTDLDFNGHTPKDIIVPYYIAQTESINHNKHAKTIDTSITTTTTTTKSILLFFAGGKNPPGGIRELLETQINAIIESDHSNNIIYTTKKINENEYNSYINKSIFCLSIRGDTASSSRLFGIINANCIPVLISDWLPLPFENIIDYSKFSIRFPESIVHDVRILIEHLRTIPLATIQSYQESLLIARQLLLYPTLISGSKIYAVNPISLTLIEMLLQRQVYCQYQAGDIGNGRIIANNGGMDMCSKLHARFRTIVLYIYAKQYCT